MNHRSRSMGLVSDGWSKDVLLAVLVVLAAPLLYNLWWALLSMLWTPLRIKKAFQAQGIACLPFRFITGNLPEYRALRTQARCCPMLDLSHDIAPRMLPHLYQWPKLYGDRYVYWLGSQARWDAVDAENAKEVLSTKFGYYPKPDLRPDALDLHGRSIVSLEGEEWALHRRILNPAFFLEKLKAMIPAMEACTIATIEKWDASVERGQAIDVHKEMKDLTADIIAHTAFGSSFEEGKKVFQLQHQQQIFMEKAKTSVYIPGSRWIPIASNRFRWKINGEIKRALRQVVNKRLELNEVDQCDSHGKDLLGLLMAANKGELQGHQKKLIMSIDDIIEECRIFFFAGHETTSTLLTWAFLLLAINLEWQERTRKEVQVTCGMQGVLTVDSLNHLKIMGMVLNEVLRLYPPAVDLLRKASRDMQLGNVLIPKGTVVTLPILAWHHDKRYWGSDVNEFRPERFSEGVAKACSVPGAFMPFSMGPRVCIGQSFAMLEVKVVLALVLRCYRFRLSPTYQHAPITVLTMQPQFGMPILFEKL